MKTQLLDICSLAICGLLSLAACSDGNAPEDGTIENDNYITFKTDIEDIVTTKGDELSSTDAINNLYVTSFFGTDHSKAYFTDGIFTRSGSIFKSEYLWTYSTLEFFSYYNAGEKLTADWTSGNTTYTVSPDIDKHRDFVTAHAIAAYSEVGKPVGLTLNHQLSQIEVKAKCSNSKYKVEVAGIRLGKPVTRATFNFFANENAGGWNSADATRQLVKYIFTSGDHIVTLKEEPESLMGNGKNAIVIPTAIDKWDAANDRKNVANGMYFSILIRVYTTIDDKEVQLYPAAGLEESDKLDTQKFIVNKVNNNIVSSYTTGATVAADQEVKEFAWAAIPVSVTWEPGKYYTYTLNYSLGVGIRDPEETNHPGDPILGGDITLTVTLNDWESGEDSTLTVPGTGKGN